MFKSYLKTALRNLIRNKTFSFIHIAGLTIGITCLIFIMKYVTYELSFDKFPEHSGRIYRITSEDYAMTPVPLFSTLKEFYPGIVQTLRINKVPRKLVSYNNRNFYEERIILADPSIFEMFSYKLQYGNEKTALNNPNSIVITSETAIKYFGNDNPVGKTLTLDGYLQFQVSGVLKDLPQNSHLRFDFICPITSAKAVYNDPRFFDSYMNTFVYSYFMTDEHTDLNSLMSRLNEFNKYYSARSFIPFEFKLQPITSIHLNSALSGELEPNSDITYVYVFSSAALLILLIACINYVNLSTARYMTRIKEVGIRKVVGAKRSQLILQFIGEAVIVSFLAVLLSIVLVILFTPKVSSFLGSREAFTSTPGNWLLYLCLMTLILGLASGLYPAFFVSKFQVVQILSKSDLFRKSRINLRSLLVIFQFSISTALILLTIVINLQLSFIQKRNSELSKEEIIILPVVEGSVRQQYRALKNELLKNPSILSASFSSAIPGSVKWVTSFQWEGQKNIKDNTLNFIAADYEFLKTYKIKISDGRDFSEEFPSDKKQGYIINEAALKRLGWKSPIGKRLELFDHQEGRVIGMVKDFHFKSLHSKIEPLCIFIDPNQAGYISVRVKTDNMQAVLEHIENTWKKFSSGRPFEYSFFDEYLAQLYSKEENIGRLFDSFAIIAIFIACMGIFGLAAFTSERRKKEIGIRKVLGASTMSIAGTLVKDFLLLAGISIIIGCTVSYYFAVKWLSNFAYHIVISPWIFLLAGALVAVIVFSTVLTVVLKAANADSVENLRYE
ncbi:MAG TPA: ABC transporter permease [Ignavibacteriales bacterium]|nr:ABC transporter permease [Ignavibacteriales bacterium]